MVVTNPVAGPNMQLHKQCIYNLQPDLCGANLLDSLEVIRGYITGVFHANHLTSTDN